MGTAAISAIPAEDAGLGECFSAGVCSCLQVPPHITGGAAPGQAAGPGSCLGRGQQLPADTKNAQASEIWRMSTCCEKPRSLLFPHSPSSLAQSGLILSGLLMKGGPSVREPLC